MKTRTKIVLLAVPLLLAIGYLSYRHVEWKLLGRKSAKIQSDLETGWHRSPFISLSNDKNYVRREVLAKLASQLPNLANEQREELASAVGRLLQANSKASSRDYSEFRFPVVNPGVPMGWNIEWLKYKQEQMRRAGAEPVFNGDPVGAADDQLQGVTLQFFEIAGSLTNGAGKPSFCTSCWTDVSIEKIGAAIRESGTNKKLQDYVLDRGNINLTKPTPSAAYLGTEISDEVYVSFVVRTRGEHSVYPVFVHFRWNSAHSKWLPMDMIIPKIVGFEGSILF